MNPAENTFDNGFLGSRAIKAYCILGGLALWVIGILELLFPYSRLLNCGSAGCLWDNPQPFPFFLGYPELVIFSFIVGELLLLVPIFWDVLN